MEVICDVRKTGARNLAGSRDRAGRLCPLRAVTLGSAAGSVIELA